MSTLLSVSVAMLAGLLMTRIAKKLKLPAVTAYLVAGVLIGPYCLGAMHIDGLGFTSSEAVSALSLVSEVALGFIAFSIGNEFRLEDLKATGRQTAVIGVVQALPATLPVDLALVAVHFIAPDKLSVSQAITLGAIATATAPAATLMVVRQYKAKGPLTDLLLPIVALDDAVGLVAFAVSFGIARTLHSGVVDLVSILVNPLVEIAASLLLGAVLGCLLTHLEKLFNSNTNRLNLTIAFVFLTASLAMTEFQIGPVTVGFSSLLVCMMLGTVFCNLCPLSQDLMDRADKWTSPLFGSGPARGRGGSSACSSSSAARSWSWASSPIGSLWPSAWCISSSVPWASTWARSAAPAGPAAPPASASTWVSPCCPRPAWPWVCASPPWSWAPRAT